MSYQVKLTVFEGPLDLLLQLIERRELDITTISLAAVTDQYLEYISLLTNVEPEILTEFLVIAARLIFIKSQALLPRPPQPTSSEEDVGQNLVRQLAEYKRFKEIAALLKQRDEQGLRSYIRLAATGMTPRVQIDGVTLDDLAHAMRQVLLALPDEAAAPELPRPQFTMAEKIVLIEGILRQGRVRFGDLLCSVTSRTEAIVTFLALLELIKQGRVTVVQAGIFGEITIDPANGNGVPATSLPEPRSGQPPEYQ